MQIILSDHNCEGQAEQIFDVLRFDDLWLQLVPMELLWFEQVGLTNKAKDELIWKLCQKNRYLLLTGNRTADDAKESLEMSIRRQDTTNCLPVLTISNLKRVSVDPDYCRACAERLIEIVDDLDKFLGVTRLYLYLP